MLVCGWGGERVSSHFLAELEEFAASAFDTEKQLTPGGVPALLASRDATAHLRAKSC